MENNIINKIISMLLDKGYVRCGFDGITIENFEYIENNIENIMPGYKSIFSDKESEHKEVILKRYNTLIYLDSNDNQELEYDNYQ